MCNIKVSDYEEEDTLNIVDPDMIYFDVPESLSSLI